MSSQEPGETEALLPNSTENNNIDVSEVNYSSANNDNPDVAINGVVTPNKPGAFIKFIRSTFGFNKIPFTLVFIAVYLYIIASLASIQSGDPATSSLYPQNYTDDAWTDLQHISQQFHPYASHANDEVHDYIFSRAQEAAAKHALSSSNKTIEVIDDVRSLLYEQADVFNPNIHGRVVSFEANNILVRIPGQDPTLGSVLLSAHYDSVPTAFGTTDDGTGIASMLSILRWFSDNPDLQFKRSLIFNFNNNEEFGLLGAEAFVASPWFEDVEVFVNLEGTGAGGRSILFRASDYGVAKHYAAARTPHGNSIYQQGFTEGLVRSETDYKVYTGNGLRGLDIAFYTPRDIYHTRRDSIRSTSIDAVQHMFSTALDTVRSLTSAGADDFSDPVQQQPAVFFDILGKYFIVLPLSQLFVLNIISLALGPVILGFLLIVVVRSRTWDIGIRGWFRGLFSLAASIAVTGFWAYWLYQKNEFVLVSQTYIPLLTAFSLFVVAEYIILGFAGYLRPVHDQKLIIFLELFVILWIILVLSTVRVSTRQVTGEYAVLILYSLVSLSIFLGLLSHVFTGSRKKKVKKLKGHNHSSSSVHYVHYDTIHYDSSPVPASSSEVEGHHTIMDHHDTVGKLRHLASKSLSYDWSLQFAVLVPIGLYFIYGLGILVLQGLHQTSLESLASSQSLFYLIVFVASGMGILVMPFVHRLHVLALFVLVLFVVIGTIWSGFSKPFNHSSPMKLRFLQRIDLDSVSDPKPIVSVVGRAGQVKEVLEGLPSIKASNQIVECEAYGNEKDDIELCHYEGLRPWIISSPHKSSASDYFHWLNITVLKKHEELEGVAGGFGPYTGEIFIEVPENRVCGIAFNTSNFPSENGGVSPVRVFTLFKGLNDPGDGTILKYYKGINDVTVHKLNWTEQGYRVGFEWVPRWFDGDGDQDKHDNGLGITVTCRWGEYDAQSLIGNNTLVRKIPALDEVLEYSPRWVSWSNWGEGLVEVTKYTEI